MDYLLDTCTLVDIEKVKSLMNGNFWISDITIFERTKNRSYNDKIEILNNTINLLAKHRISIYIKKERYKKALELSPETNLKRFDEIGLDVTRHVYRNFLNFLGAVLMTIIAIKNNIQIKNNELMISENVKAMNFINIISKSMTELDKKYCHKIAKIIFKDSTNINNTKPEVDIANISINYYNQSIVKEELKLRNISNFNYDELIKGNRIKFKKKELKQYIDCFTSVEANQKITKSIYLAYATELFFYGGKLEFNDIIDMNLISAAISKNKIFLTSDKKVQRVVKHFEEKYQSDNILSSSVKIVIF